MAGPEETFFNISPVPSARNPKIPEKYDLK